MTIDKREVITNNKNMATQDKNLTSFMWIIGIVVTIFCGALLTVALSYGQTKEKVVQHDADILYLRRRSVDIIYIQDLIQSNYMLVDILKSAPQSLEMEEALKKWKEFQISTMLRANPTRGGSQGGGSSSN